MTRTLLPLFLVPVAACAQERLDTDRPDRTESTTVVPTGSIQVETGATYALPMEGPVSWSVPQMLFRLGLAERIELRAEGEHIRYTDADGQVGYTRGPLAFGAKLGLGSGGRSGIRSATLLTVSVPRPESGSTGFPFAGITLLADRDLGERWGIGANIGMQWNDRTPVPSTIYSLTTSVDVSRHLAAYIECYGSWADHGLGDHRWNGGATWAVGENLLLDASLGNGLLGQGWFFSAGFSFRFQGWTPSAVKSHRAVRRA